MITLRETMFASEVLRRYTGCFERCVKAGRMLEARTYLPNIRRACIELNLDFVELLGSEYERLFTDNEPFMNRSLSAQEPKLSAHLSAQNSEITVQSVFNRSLSDQDNMVCSGYNCNQSLKGKRKGARFCSDKCKNQSR